MMHDQGNVRYCQWLIVVVINVLPNDAWSGEFTLCKWCYDITSYAMMQVKGNLRFVSGQLLF